jgi:hypothetical protein
LVGSTKASKWDRSTSEANFKRLDFAKVPALDAYYNSLVNLGCFVTDEERADSDEEAEEVGFTFDDIQLSPLGLQLAEGYDSLVGRLESVRSISASHRKCSVKSLREWGKRGGLCELIATDAPDQPLLWEIFFAKANSGNESHGVRNHSLVLILELCRQLSAGDWSFDVHSFGQAVYYGEVVNDDGEHISIKWPSGLADNANRWRMFYFHHYMSVALEGMFTWLVTHVSEKGIAGATTDELAAGLNGAIVHRELGDFLKARFSGLFGGTTPADFFNALGINCQLLDESSSQRLDLNLRADAKVAEHWLEEAIRMRTFLHSQTGLAVPMILFVLTLARYRRWAATDYGNWLASAANDPYLDLVPPVVLNGLDRCFGDWWTKQWSELADFVLSRYVVQQHQALSYEKTAKGDRCLLQVDGQKIIADFPHEKIGIGNPRFNSAIQILTDLALLEVDDDEITRLTAQGKSLLKAELQEIGAL